MPKPIMQPQTNQDKRWTVVSDTSSSQERCHKHGLQYAGDTYGIYTGPQGKALLIQICDHLNKCGSIPLEKPLPKKPKQLSFF